MKFVKTIMAAALLTTAITGANAAYDKGKQADTTVAEMKADLGIDPGKLTLTRAHVDEIMDAAFDPGQGKNGNAKNLKLFGKEAIGEAVKAYGGSANFLKELDAALAASATAGTIELDLSDLGFNVGDTAGVAGFAKTAGQRIAAAIRQEAPEITMLKRAHAIGLDSAGLPELYTELAAAGTDKGKLAAVVAKVKAWKAADGARDLNTKITDRIAKHQGKGAYAYLPDTAGDDKIAAFHATLAAQRKLAKPAASAEQVVGGRFLQALADEVADGSISLPTGKKVTDPDFDATLLGMFKAGSIEVTKLTAKVKALEAIIASGGGNTGTGNTGTGAGDDSFGAADF